ncbi:MAG: hypothetical protein A2Z20_12220 [Bdellovibrionales bacterium RBG_16_40_8]|nr:MAG: hypothetical protein A2Z20_12220 [Bdellovibrionales bacterium RBG_16_40_8]
MNLEKNVEIYLNLLKIDYIFDSKYARIVILFYEILATRIKAAYSFVRQQNRLALSNQCLHSWGDFMTSFKNKMRQTVVLMIVLISAISITACFSTSDQGSQTIGSATTQPPDFTSSPSDPGQNNDVSVLVEPPPAANEQSGNIRPVSGVSLIINNGADRTSDPIMHLSVLLTEYAEIGVMKIGFTNDCSDGEWGDFTDNIDILSPTLNGEVTVSIQFQDYDRVLSQCITSSIMHDNEGPEITFTTYPSASIEQGSRASISYSVTDASAISSVTCRLNQLEKPCLADSNNIDISEMPEGSYIFSIDAVDELGNTSHGQVAWSVVSSTKHLLQSILVRNENKVDILVVIDNSGSMAYEQQSMALRTSNFLSILQGLDWRIAITTTDPTATLSVNTADPKLNGLIAPVGSKKVYKYVSDGLFLPINNHPGEFYIESTLSQSDAQNRLSQTLQRPETGSGKEQAIYATYRMIERGFTEQNKNPVQHNFFRDGANFSALVISDEDESASGTKNDPQNLMSLVYNTFQGQKAFSWHSIITKPKDENCLKTYGATYGERYNQLSLMTGGLIGSVCESDYASQLAGIANGIRQLVKTLTLSCQPLPQFPIVVLKDGQTYSGTYTIEGVNLKFDAELPAGGYSIDYHCLK